MLLQIRNICKRFADMYALKDVSFDIAPGEVHALVGENGAGKSTLIKILTGVYSLDSGEIVWLGENVDIVNPRQSRELGINVIHQDRHLVPSFNGVENAYLGMDYITDGIKINWKKMEKRVSALMDELDIHIPLQLCASELTPPQKTLLEIVRAMMIDCKLLILDEPTASLTDQEAQHLFKIIRNLKKRGTSILYVSHRMDEIFELSDRITVLKNGTYVDTVNTKDTDKDSIISLMTDNWKNEKTTKKVRNFGDALLIADSISSYDGIVKSVSLTVHAGEILGVFGLGGSGRTETLECIYGSRLKDKGSIQLAGRNYSEPQPRRSIEQGMVIICEDRRGKALVTRLSVQENTVLSVLENYIRFGIVNKRSQRKDTLEKISSLSIKTQSPDQPVEQLSGGNQQKVVFAKALMSNPKVILCDEPTQAVDVKTRQEIHSLLMNLAENGAGIVFVSSDLKEVLEVADTVQIIAAGESKECFVNQDLTAETVLGCCYSK